MPAESTPTEQPRNDLGQFQSPNATTQTPPPEKPKEPTPEEKAATERGSNRFLNAFLGDEEPAAPRTEEPTTTEEPLAKPAAKPTAKAPEKPAATAKPKVPAKPKAPVKPAAAPLTPEQIAAAAAEGATRALRTQAPPAAKPEPDPKAATEGLNPEQKKQLAVLQHMETMYGDKYKGMSQKYVGSVQKLNAYVEDWKRKHPGEDFDENAPEHDDFYAANMPDWDTGEFDEAKLDMLVEQRLAARTKPLEEKLSKVELAEKAAQAAPQIAADQTTAARTFWSALGDKFKDMISETGEGNITLGQQAAKDDPEGYGMMVNTGRILDIETEQLYKLFNGLTEFQNDPNAQPVTIRGMQVNLFGVHQELSRFALEQEQRILQQEPEAQLDARGRQFLPMEQYSKLPKAQQEAHWTMTPRYLAALRAADLAQKVNAELARREENLTQIARRRGWLKDEKPPESRGAAPAQPQPEPEPEPQKPASPSAGLSPTAAGRRAAGAPVAPDPALSFLERGI